MEDYKQITYKLQTDIEMKVWENTQKNIPFLKEMKQRLRDYQTEKDVTQLEMVYQMIDDWIAELEMDDNTTKAEGTPGSQHSNNAVLPAGGLLVLDDEYTDVYQDGRFLFSFSFSKTIGEDEQRTIAEQFLTAINNAACR